MKIKNIANIYFKEILQYFDNIGTIVLFIVVFAIHYFFFISYFFDQKVVTLDTYFMILPWIVLLYVPAITMNLFSKERDKNTIDLLLTQPITNSEITIAKIKAGTLLAYIPILMSVALPIYVSNLGTLDIGQVVASYIGALIYVMSLVSIGIGISSFFKNQIAGFLVTEVVFVILNLINTPLFNKTTGGAIADLFFRISAIDNYNSLVTGAYDFDRISYFIIIFAIGYLLTLFNLDNLKTNDIQKTFNYFGIKFLILAIVVFSLLVLNQRINYRLDLTDSKRFTLSEVTRNFIQDKNNSVKVDAYISSDLPPQLLQLEREVKNTLDSFKHASKGNIQLQYLDPETNQEAIQAIGITPRATINRSTEDVTTSVKYFSIVVSDMEVKNQEVINVENPQDLELSIIRSINQVLKKETPKVAYLSGYGIDSTPVLSTMQQMFTGFFNIDLLPMQATADASAEAQQQQENNAQSLNLQDINFVILDNPKEELPENIKQQLLAYYENGGDLFVNLVPYTITGPSAPAQKSQTTNNELFKSLGLSVNKDLIFDTVNAADIPTGNMYQPYFKYPFYPVVNLDDKYPESKFYAKNTFVLFGSSLDIEEGSGWLPMYKTTNLAGSKSDDSIEINQEKATFQGSINRSFVNAAQIKNEKGGSITVISSNDFFRTLRDLNPSFIMLANTMDINTSSVNYASIKSKSTANFIALEDNPNYQNIMTYAVPAIGFALIILAGLLRLYRNIKLKNKFAPIAN